MNMNNKSGFTLLEIIVVIIIVGVLASLALPRLIQNVDYSRSIEAQNAFKEIRGSMNRCVGNTGSYATCINFSNNAVPQLDMPDPGIEPGANFTYIITVPFGGGVAANSYSILADGSYTGNVAADTIRYEFFNSGLPATNLSCVDGQTTGDFTAILQGDCNGRAANAF